MLTRADLLERLRIGGIRRGAVVHVQSNLRRIGLIEGASTGAEILDFYLSALQEAVGPAGTITTFTLFTAYGRYGTPYIREESPSDGGVLSEWIRTRPGAVRSLHPIVSVTALGARAEYLCGNSHFSGYGHDSPWTRLLAEDAIILSLGLGSQAGGTSFFHYIEAAYGVPYQYIKLFDHPVYSGGKRIPGPFSMTVRYLDFGIGYDTSRARAAMVDKGVARLLPLGAADMLVVPARRMFDFGIDWLNADRYGFLTAPPRFRPGEMPMDSVTGTMQVAVDRTDAHPGDNH